LRKSSGMILIGQSLDRSHVLLQSNHIRAPNAR
jgi:hypothetical protein